DVEEHVASALDHLSHGGRGGPVEMSRGLRPFDELALPAPLLERLGGDEVIVDAVPFPRARRAGGVRDPELAARKLRQEPPAGRRLAGPRRSRDDDHGPASAGHGGVFAPRARHSRFWTCSRMASTVDRMRSAAWQIPRDSDFEEMVLASRLISCITKSRV